MKHFISLLLIIMPACIFGQNCPDNIGFEKGTLDNWVCLTGEIDRAGQISLAQGPPNDLHTLIEKGSTEVKDYFGDFPVSCPNGSKYSLKLNTGGNPSGRAVGVSYTFVVPNVQSDYSIIYNYAVVLENPPHDAFEQPQFTVKVFDVTANQYIDCGAFQFVASSNLPGFKESTVKREVYYKPWAPITLKLSAFKGKTIRLEFTVNDCARKGHFGYAYLDVNENCSEPITGNVFCAGSSVINLKAPYGFQAYKWYTEDFSTLLGTDNILQLSPLPPVGTKIVLEITPFPNQGCLDTLKTEIKGSSDPFNMVTVQSLSGCEATGVNLTAASVTTGSSPGISFTYFTDVSETEYLPSPEKLIKSGIYYIKGNNAAGCSETRPIGVTILNTPNVQITSPPVACIPGAVDLTVSAVTAGSSPGLSFSYWEDPAATKPLSTPAALTRTGTYYIKGTNSNNCSDVMPVMVTLSNPPAFSVSDIEACDAIALTDAASRSVRSAVTSTSFSYWLDAAGTTSPLTPGHIFKTTTSFYVKGTEPVGCAVMKPAKVTIHPLPVFKATDPLPATRPAVVDLTQTVPVSSSWVYSYWYDRTAVRPISAYQQVAKTGKYYVKAITPYACSLVDSVQVTIIDPPIIPPNAFSPNGDGINDTWLIPILQYYPECSVEVYNRAGHAVYKSSNGYSKPWDGIFEGKKLPVATYYYIIRLSSLHQPSSGSVTLLK
ncbi:gliding motility-associated C-terminal domain-containing protein [Sediminibacterium ginsengisoli]|uniref:Gliding motility-associated C-terminal domain-containing protein n=2 Tax=Sediminibacterium ginsengisoli TaxID=413434 RepID=A0A1T4P5U0_9BACT|nr:gliding motility-associated C-terminal domain-containing protein [Sediminibacterium ginsengisoli]